MHEHELIEEESVTYCEVHPDRETTLRCNKCGRLMCVECAVQTPVGYRCRECVRAHEDKFYSGTDTDYLIIFAVCAVLTMIGGAILGNLPLLFLLFLGIIVGSAIGELALRAVKRRRGRYSSQVAVGGVIVGGVLSFPALVFFQTGLIILEPGVILNISTLVYTGLVATTIYSLFRLRV